MNESIKYLNKMHCAASKYAQLFNWPVFPVNIEKRPLTTHGFKDATTDQKQIKSWYELNPSAGVAVATGKVSGLTVLDIDSKPDASEILSDLETEFGSLPITAHAITGGGGYHFFFKYEDGATSCVGVRTGVDIRADGGYIVLPPSLHCSGRTYSWESSHHINEVPIASMPSWLLPLIKGTNRSDQKHSSDFWSSVLGAPIPDGRRNETLCQITGHLLRRYVDPAVVLAAIRALNKTHCSPPLPDGELVKLVDSLAGRELQRRQGRGVA